MYSERTPISQLPRVRKSYHNNKCYPGHTHPLPQRLQTDPVLSYTKYRSIIVSHEKMMEIGKERTSPFCLVPAREQGALHDLPGRIRDLRSPLLPITLLARSEP
jgi:hypothetical protein